MTDLIAVNAYILYRKLMEEPLRDQLEFRTALVQELLQAADVLDAASGVDRHDDACREPFKHAAHGFPSVTSRTGGGVGDHRVVYTETKRKCAFCRVVHATSTRTVKTGGAVRHESHFKCEQCGVHLCMAGSRLCWNNWHSVDAESIAEARVAERVPDS